ncbi:MAG TPA: hypothetical protein DIT81_02445 [Alistipes obesi]|jgi:hypothetical protein|uniref:hypothetical protein n=1 Tax=Alistipes communis TaxID=2585118 RepID=UPI000EDB0C9E|nr:hypothetical protein [Alistipes communis]HCP57988.1 hypothetical protein [Alistipes communis]
MTKELYINGQLCDLEDTPSLIFQSPVFNDLDVIQSNRSAEINLPLTPRNRKAFGLIDRIDILDDSAVYGKHSAAYYLGGFPVFTRGYAMVTDVTDTINITLVWGNIDNFQPLFDASLRDLREQIIEVAGADYVEWNENTKYVDPDETTLAGFIQIDFGAGRNINYSHPSVQVSAILDAIQKYHGITIENITRLSQTSDKHPMIVPLVSKNSGPDSWYSDRFEASSAHYGNSGSSNTALKFREIVSDKRSILTDQNYAIDVSSTKTIDVSIISYSSAVFFPGMRAASASPTLKLRGDSGNGTSEVLLSVEGIDTGSGIRFGVKPDLFNNVEVNVEDYDTVRWILSNAVTIDATTSDEFTVAAKFIITPHFDDIQFPSPFPIAENLPDMTHAEFLSALMTMAGLFAYPDSSDSNTIRMMSPDQFYNSTDTIDYDYRIVDSGDNRTPNTQTDRRIVNSHLDATIQDWSRKVILNDRGEIWRPEGTEFTMGDYAQTNTLDYDNDEDAEMLNTQGIISIDNENIERENELVSLDFSASTNRAGWNTDHSDWPFAFVPCYEEQTVNGAKEVNYSAPSARILADVNTTIEDGNGTVGRYRHGLFPRTMYFGGSEGIVAKRYADYQRILKKFRMITVYVKLTVADICNLDYTRRVYLDVYGCYFAIYSVTTGEDGICECKLIKL